MFKCHFYGSTTVRTVPGTFFFRAVCACIRDLILKVCSHDILSSACLNFTKYTTPMQLGTEMYLLVLEVKGRGHREISTSGERGHFLTSFGSVWMHFQGHWFKGQGHREYFLKMHFSVAGIAINS